MIAAYQRFVLIGGYHRLARSWMNARGISPQQVVEIRGPAHLPRLRGLTGQGVALVWFDGVPARGVPVPALIGMLRAGGAADLPPTWWPAGRLLRAAPPPGNGGMDEEVGEQDG